jgi:hypothetical protein
MGKILQIRVSASTYEPEDVYRAWPRLSRMAWGDKRFAQNASIGVRELVAVLNDKWKFGNDWPEAAQTTVGGVVPGLKDLDQELEAALAERRPDVADRLSYKMEDALDELEGQVE